MCAHREHLWLLCAAPRATRKSAVIRAKLGWQINQFNLTSRRMVAQLFTWIGSLLPNL